MLSLIELELYLLELFRCKGFGCSYMSCLQQSGGNQVKCMPLFRALQMCKNDEMEAIKREFELTGVQPQMQPFAKKRSCIP
jgi:hypothetical protein